MAARLSKMARSEAESRLVPSLLERLLDDHPENTHEPLGDRFYAVGQMKSSVAHDLEELLNTRREALSEPPPEFTEVNKSLIVYGLPDFTSYNLLDPADCSRIKRSLETAIARFEPRLERVRVSMQPPDPNDRILRFKIEAMLRIEPAREPVAFDTVLHLATQAYSVRGQD
jgi:type VI secretion system protein ImpF